jgi:RNA ligase (TIGR02306 family)
MSTLRAEVVQVNDVVKHPNADRLEVAQVMGWTVVVGKGRFKQGDEAVYIPVDALLPEELENKLFPPDSKIKLNKHRIRSIKIRGAMSQGLLVHKSEVGADSFGLGHDVTQFLGVTKFEPPEPEFGGGNGTRAKVSSKSQINPYFRKYTDIENIKHYHTVFQEGEMVYISEKLHGTSARYGWVPFHYEGNLGPLKALARRFFSSFTSLVKTHQFVFGSRNVQLHTGSRSSWYKEDVYAKILKQEDLKSKLRAGECVYGEIVGHGIQKNYAYGCKEGEHKFFAYDVMVDGEWLSYYDFVAFCNQRGIDRVPDLYVGPYSKAVELKHRDGDSTVGKQKIREGVVIKPLVEETTVLGRKVLKSISDAYYLEDNSDFH